MLLHVYTVHLNNNFKCSTWLASICSRAAFRPAKNWPEGDWMCFTFWPPLFLYSFVFQPIMRTTDIQIKVHPDQKVPYHFPRTRSELSRKIMCKFEVLCEPNKVKFVSVSESK